MSDRFSIPEPLRRKTRHLLEQVDDFLAVLALDVEIIEIYDSSDHSPDVCALGAAYDRLNRAFERLVPEEWREQQIDGRSGDEIMAIVASTIQDLEAAEDSSAKDEH